ncbi:MAG: thioredoxin fold domain-containing protein [Gammaproteobacteria bacterium]|nr:thioredoxin fold domain-containing protein [Gammaproteobacteria bacterium]
MKIKIFLSLVLCVFMGSISSGWAANNEERDPYKYFFNETWGDLPEELKNAKNNGKKAIFIFFEMDECPFCHYMKKNVLNQLNVQEYYRKNFLNFVIDIEGDVEMVSFSGKTVKQKDFAFKEHRVRATPVIAFFDLNGKLIHRHTGKTSGVEEFMWLGEYIEKGLYKNKKLPFSHYKRQQRENKKK